MKKYKQIPNLYKKIFKTQKTKLNKLNNNKSNSLTKNILLKIEENYL